MTHDDSIELIQVALDGEATEDERNRLESLLARSPSAGGELEAFRELARDLESAAAIEPPADFRDGVLRELRRRRESVSSPVSRRRWMIAAGWAAAAGIALVVALVPFGGRESEESVSPAHASGAMAGAGVEAWPQVATARTPDGRASAIVRREGDRVALQMELTGGAGVARVEWNREELALTAGALRRDVSAGGASVEVSCAVSGCPQLVFRKRAAGATAVSVAAAGGVPVRLEIPAP